MGVVAVDVFDGMFNELAWGDVFGRGGEVGCDEGEELHKEGF